MKGFRNLAVERQTDDLAAHFDMLDDLATRGEFGVSLILFALQDRNPEIRCYAARKLGLSGLGRHDVVQGLVIALQDEHTPLRQYAAAALGVLKPLPVSAINEIRTATEDKDATVREFSRSNLQLIERYLASLS